MAQTRKQKKREQVATMLENHFPKNQSTKELRATNRRVEKRKRQQAAQKG